MKKIISMVLVCVLLLGCVVALSSCAKTISGTYKADAGIASGTYQFKGNKVTITKEVFGFEKTYTATYEITGSEEEGYQITFTYAEGEEADDDLKGTLSFSEGKENDVTYIKIGGIKYVKQ